MVLADPPHPRWWKDCPRCHARKSLVVIRQEPDEQYGTRRICRCKKCGEETDFVDALPEGCV
ncbi:MAG: hypothetical protein O3A29_12345 [Planctomycetota bacterium]|nr:hypothetical protein [Planctomycetota bacterium]